MSEKRTDKDLANQWKTIDWEKTESIVNRLQTRIAKATQEGRTFGTMPPQTG
jgi:RNA-directed DNA polymerase